MAIANTENITSKWCLLKKKVLWFNPSVSIIQVWHIITFFILGVPTYHIFLLYKDDVAVDNHKTVFGMYV